jgi:hypothetical protein
MRMGSPSGISLPKLFQSLIVVVLCVLGSWVHVATSWELTTDGQMSYDPADFDRFQQIDWKYTVHGKELTFRFGASPDKLKADICIPLEMTDAICEETLLEAFRTWINNDYFPSNPPLKRLCNPSVNGEDFDSTCSDDTSWTSEYLATRGTILSILRQKYNYQRYLEIGTDRDILFSMAKTRFPVAVGVDPARGGTLRMTSDEFFKQLKQNSTRDSASETFDLIFIDGLHEANQVYRDVIHSLQHLSHGGTIVMHDCNPLGNLTLKTAIPKPENSFYWNGDTWKAAVAVRMLKDVEIVIVDVDQG